MVRLVWLLPMAGFAAWACDAAKRGEWPVVLIAALAVAWTAGQMLWPDAGRSR